jgi:hypothetical protein
MPEPRTLPHLCLEWGEKHGRCLACDAETVLVTAAEWKTHPEGEVDGDWAEPLGEVSGHWCPDCNRLTAVFLNSL